MLSDERLRQYLDRMFEGFIAYDREWRMTFMNAAAEEITGLRRADAVGRQWQDIFPHAVGGPMDELHRRVLESGQPERTEFFYEHYGRWYEVNATPVPDGGVAIFFRDIDDAKRREELQAHLAAIVESSDDAIVSKALDGTIRSWNAGAQRIFGYTPEEALGRSIRMIIPADRQPEEDAILAKIRAGERVDHFDTVRQAKDGRLIDISVTVSPMRDFAGRIMGASKVARDVSLRKQAEKALEDASRYKDEFLAMLAHELRNPLAPISNALQLMRIIDPASGEAQHARAIMERQLAHLVRLVEDLMDVSRITRGKIEVRKEPVLLSSVMLSAVETARPAIEAGRHKFHINMPAETLGVDGDFVRLAQVISNLLANAARYTDEGGEIWLDAAREGGEAVIRVRDNGIGIAAEALPRLFEMFGQLAGSKERSKGGLGIGLALARALVELHGGRISAASPGRGQGAEFTVRLPLAPSYTQAQQVLASLDADPRRRRRVLIVDDNVDAAETLQMVVSQMGHDVHAAHDGPAALDAARERRPDVVLLDISMPGMDGLEVVRALRSEPALRQIRVVALTGFGQQEDRRRSEAAGFDAHLVKPVSPEELRRVLER